ncbi:MAG: metallopeptidase, partial [Thermoguttaceae bacterium]|nr:metallopeptidase [Thermoguttaceae bacterium]
FRRTRWALTASTLGAGLHELGHAFGLDHSQEPTDFMSRGFDRFNRIFAVAEPPDANSSNVAETVFDDESAATWTPESANRLIRSRWIEK